MQNSHQKLINQCFSLLVPSYWCYAGEQLRSSTPFITPTTCRALQSTWNIPCRDLRLWSLWEPQGRNLPWGLAVDETGVFFSPRWKDTEHEELLSYCQSTELLQYQRPRSWKLGFCPEPPGGGQWASSVPGQRTSKGSWDETLRDENYGSYDSAQNFEVSVSRRWLQWRSPIPSTSRVQVHWAWTIYFGMMKTPISIWFVICISSDFGPS